MTVQPLSGPKDTLSTPIQLPQELEVVARCESGNRHFDGAGSILRGRYNRNDIGLFQINEIIWGKKAQELELNIYSLEGNKAMALWIYDNYGLNPWRHSFNCWKYGRR